MKKRIALFANGWTSENLVNYIKALKSGLPDNYADIYLFMSYGSYGMPDINRKAEGMVYKLPDLKTFDAAVVFGSGLNFKEDIDNIYSSIEESGIPAISIGMKHDGFSYFGVDNRPGMYELCEHLIDVHKVRSVVFLAGSAENEDSNVRLEVLKKCMADHGIAFSDDNVYYTDWEVSKCREHMEALMDKYPELPNAIICANDTLAIHATLFLSERGINIPESTIITGYDNLSQGQHYYPAITTVDQGYDDLGKLSAEKLLSIFNGDKSVVSTRINSRCIIKESCGCTDFDGDKIRRDFAHQYPVATQRNYGISGRLFALEQAILKSQSYSELTANLREIFSGNTGSEGNTFYMMLDPIFENLGKDVTLPAFTYNNEFNVIIGKHDAIPSEAYRVSRNSLVPEEDLCEQNRLYVIVSLYYESFICGYLAFGDALNSILESDLYLFNNRINRILMFFKRNLQLTELNSMLSELMDQDALTRVKNRSAYEKYLKNLEADFIEGENKPFAVIYFDINNLKMVNDMYGHEKGDAYIKNSCRLICNTFKRSPVFRIGGDEFVTVAQNDDYTNRHELLNHMREHMEALKIKGDAVPLTERISIASGMAEYDRTLDDDFASIFKRADELMYENKYRMKNSG